MWKVGNRGWICITVGVATGRVTDQGALGRDNEHKRLAGWDFAGLGWHLAIGLILGLDFFVEKFGVYAPPFDHGGIELSCTWNPFCDCVVQSRCLGTIVPLWIFGVIVPVTVAVIGSGSNGTLLLISLMLAIVAAALLG